MIDFIIPDSKLCHLVQQGSPLLLLYKNSVQYSAISSFGNVLSCVIMIFVSHKSRLCVGLEK